MATAIEKTTSEFSKAYQAAEDVLQDCIENNRKPTFEECQFMESKLGWDKEQRRRQLSRIEVVNGLQAEAGTSEQRTKANEALDEARATLEEKEPAITDQINALIAQRDKLRNEVSRLERLVDGSTKALENLKAHVPRHIAEKANSLKVNANETIGREYHDLAGRIRHMEALTQAALHASPKEHMDCVSRYNSAFVLFDVRTTPTLESGQSIAVEAFVRTTDSRQIGNSTGNHSLLNCQPCVNNSANLSSNMTRRNWQHSNHSKCIGDDEQRIQNIAGTPGRSPRATPGKSTRGNSAGHSTKG